MPRRILSQLAILFLITGCASVSPAQVGQTTGSIVGAVLAPGIGMPLGALVGTLAGLVIENQMDKVREQEEHVELTQQLNAPAEGPSAQPSETAFGQPTRVWVDETVDNGRLMAGHFEVRNIP